jgi:hypothetical protein
MHIGSALHSYHDNVKKIPPGWIGPNASGTFMGWGWQTKLLPYLDEVELYNRMNFSLPVGATSGTSATAVQTVLRAVRCPSDRGSDTVTIADANGAKGVFGRSNYVAVYGASDAAPTGPQIVPWGVVPAGAGGAFHQNSRRHFDDFKDGLAYVIVVGERRSPAKVGRSTVGGDAIWAGIPAAPKQIKPGEAPNGTAADQQYQAYIVGDGHPLTPLNYHLSRLPWGAIPASPANPKATGFGSWHADGAHFLMGGGAVHFFSDKVDPEIFRNLSTIADGKMIDDY